MSRRGYSLTRVFSAWLTIAYLRISRVLPLSISRTFTVLIGRIAYYIVPRIRKVGLANLELAYGDSLSRAEKIRILKGSVHNLALVSAEFSRIPDLAAGKLAHLFTVEGLEQLDRTQPLFFIGAHLGNWEWIAPAMSLQGFRVAEIIRKLDHLALNRCVDALRTSTGVRTVPKTGAARTVNALIKQGWAVGLLVDQSPRKNAMPVTFFGKPCWASAAPAIIAARAHAKVHVITMLRQDDGRYCICFHPPLEFVKTDNYQADLQENTQRCQNVLESIVRQYPEQWLWFHRRWKARPSLEQMWNSRKARQHSS